MAGGCAAAAYSAEMLATAIASFGELSSAPMTRRLTTGDELATVVGALVVASKFCLLSKKAFWSRVLYSCHARNASTMARLAGYLIPSIGPEPRVAGLEVSTACLLQSTMYRSACF